MNRREFLGCCAAAGLTLGFGGVVSCIGPAASLSRADADLLRGLRIVDAHAHPERLYGGGNPDSTTPTVEIMKRIGVAGSSFSAVGDLTKFGRSGSGVFSYSNTLNQLQRVKWLAETKRVKLILKASDLPYASSSDLPGAIMAIEGGDALEGKIGNLDRFYDDGVRMITLLHDHNNEIGFNQRSHSDGPLTPFGTKVVEKMNELGMIVDVAHSKTQTMKGIIEASATPVVDSHTNPIPYKPSNPTRLRTWSELELIAGNGGVICTWPFAYSRGGSQRTTLKDWAEEIVLMKSRLGMEHCGLGTDGGGHLPETVKGWESIASLPHLVRAMGEAGLSQEDIAAYVGGNFLRILNQCLGGAKRETEPLSATGLNRLNAKASKGSSGAGRAPDGGTPARRSI